MSDCAPLRCYVGYDSHEDIAFQVAKYSMRKHSSVPLDIFPLDRRALQQRGIYRRQLDPKQSTEFTYCRFFVPYLNNYTGWALFADDDFLWLGDINELFKQCDDKYAVMCVQHDYQPSETTKLANRKQDNYPRKNWSSMMLVNCAHPANAYLNLNALNVEPGSILHRFAWLEDKLIGSLDVEWNFLVGWYTPYDGRLPKAIHYTEGGPWFPDYRCVDYSDVWFQHLREYESTLQAPRQLCPYERFSTKGNTALPGYPNSSEVWSWPE